MFIPYSLLEKVKELLIDNNIRVKLDDREEESVGKKFNEWELKGVSLRIEIGQQEQKKQTITFVRRDNGNKQSVSYAGISESIIKELDEIQKSLFKKAQNFMNKNTHIVSSYDEFKHIMQTNRGFIKAFLCENTDCEVKIKEETKASTRALPFDATQKEVGECIICHIATNNKWYFAQSY